MRVNTHYQAGVNRSSTAMSTVAVDSRGQTTFEKFSRAPKIKPLPRDLTREGVSKFWDVS